MIHTPALDVLLIERADAPGYLADRDRLARTRRTKPLVETAGARWPRKPASDCGVAAARLARQPARLAPGERLRDLPALAAPLCARRDPQHRARLRPARAARARRCALTPREHLRFEWLPWREAADRCFSPSNAEAILQLPQFLPDPARRAMTADPPPHFHASTLSSSHLRVATYNIHKGVHGIGPREAAGDPQPRPRRRGARRRHRLPAGGAQAEPRRGAPLSRHQDRLARSCRRPTSSRPRATRSVYQTNATTRDGEHGNALLSRWPIGDIGHHDMSDHRFEQRGLLHVPVDVERHARCTRSCAPRPDPRQPGAPGRAARRASSSARCRAGEPLIVAGDFNDWGDKLDAPMNELRPARACVRATAARVNTFPSRLPLFSLDRIYVARLPLPSRPRCRAARPGRACRTTCR